MKADLRNVIAINDFQFRVLALAAAQCSVANYLVYLFGFSDTSVAQKVLSNMLSLLLKKPYYTVFPKQCLYS